jgi:hypothetical protein
MTPKEARLARSMSKMVLDSIKTMIAKKTVLACSKKSTDDGLMIGAHAVAFFQALLASLVYARKLKGQFKDVRNHFNLNGKYPDALRTSAEDACVVMSEYLSSSDPEFDYQFQIVRKPKK